MITDFLIIEGEGSREVVTHSRTGASRTKAVDKNHHSVTTVKYAENFEWIGF